MHWMLFPRLELLLFRIDSFNKSSSVLTISAFHLTPAGRIIVSAWQPCKYVNCVFDQYAYDVDLPPSVFTHNEH